MSDRRGGEGVVEVGVPRGSVPGETRVGPEFQKPPGVERTGRKLHRIEEGGQGARWMSARPYV